MKLPISNTTRVIYPKFSLLYPCYSMLIPYSLTFVGVSMYAMYKIVLLKHTVLLKGNVANAHNFIATTSAY